MPSRIWILGIVVFWVATIAWLFVRDVVPKIESDEPTFFPVDQADEFNKKFGNFHRRIEKQLWSVDRTPNFEHYGLSTSVLYYEDDDSFELSGGLRTLGQNPLPSLILKEAKLPLYAALMTNHYRFDRSGRLSRLFITTQYHLGRPSGQQGDPWETSCTVVDSAPRDGNFSPSVAVSVKDLIEENETTLEPVQVSNKGTVLNPLHPVNRIQGLHTDQAWQCAAIDPMFIGPVRSEMMARQPTAGWDEFLHGKPALQILNARVRRELQEINWHNKDYDCFVIDFVGEGAITKMTTTVRASDGLVLLQEVKLWGDSWTILREKEQ